MADTPLMVTRGDGVPVPDQAMGVELFKAQCRIAALERELAQAHAELAVERQRYAQDCSDMVAYVKSFGTLNEAIKVLGARADAWEAKFNDQCTKHDETTRRAMTAERRADEAMKAIEDMAERGYANTTDSRSRAELMRWIRDQARAFLDAAKKEG